MSFGYVYASLANMPIHHLYVVWNTILLYVYFLVAWWFQVSDSSKKSINQILLGRNILCHPLETANAWNLLVSFKINPSLTCCYKTRSLLRVIPYNIIKFAILIVVSYLLFYCLIVVFLLIFCPWWRATWLSLQNLGLSWRSLMVLSLRTRYPSHQITKVSFCSFECPISKVLQWPCFSFIEPGNQRPWRPESIKIHENFGLRSLHVQRGFGHF